MHKDNKSILLKQIGVIVNKHEEIARLKQERFNVFSILRKEHDEEKLHSAFVAELLNVNGCHDLGNTFLKLFVDRFSQISFSTNGHVSTYREKSFAEGRADIYIQNASGDILLIENKIHAIDQCQQLYRYYSHIKTLNCQGCLFYLTLHGDIPSDQSVSGPDGCVLEDGKDYICISYESDIMQWLKDCLKESVSSPTVRETIKQYITLVKKLT